MHAIRTRESDSLRLDDQLCTGSKGDGENPQQRGKNGAEERS
jgi:hypothetical protein